MRSLGKRDHKRVDTGYHFNGAHVAFRQSSLRDHRKVLRIVLKKKRGPGVAFCVDEGQHCPSPVTAKA